MTALLVRRGRLKGKRKKGALYVDCELENVRRQDRREILPNLPVDKTSMYTWLPTEALKPLGIGVFKKSVSFQMADGTVVERPTGMAMLRVSGFETLDEVIFARPGDRAVLGARTLTGFGVRFDG